MGNRAYIFGMAVPKILPLWKGSWEDSTASTKKMKKNRLHLTPDLLSHNPQGDICRSPMGVQTFDKPCCSHQGAVSIKLLVVGTLTCLLSLPTWQYLTFSCPCIGNFGMKAAVLGILHILNCKTCSTSGHVAIIESLLLSSCAALCLTTWELKF